MNESKLRTLEQLRAFLQGTLEVEFSPTVGQDKAQRYAHIQELVGRFGYARLPRSGKAVVLRYLAETRTRPTPSRSTGRSSGFSRP
ncbi:MAG: hypothetical protein ACKVQA_16905 [Burkholderiales bacterium]